MSVITRFSPSPTGYLHVGNVRTALINYLFAKNKGGKFFLRSDDTDFARSKEEYFQQILIDLKWLGLDWDDQFRQSQNLQRYSDIKEELISKNFLYPCYETQEELSIQRKVQLSRGLPPIYDRSSLLLSEDAKNAYADKGVKPYYRFKLADESVSWVDGIRGKIEFKTRAFSDPVLVRDDLSPTYTFCSVIDDIDHKITDVIRGEDHITNTAIQIQIFNALSGKFPNFHHLSLLKTKDGELSKRVGGNEVTSLKLSGIDAMTLNSYLSKIGSSENIIPTNKLHDLVKDFSMSKFSHGAITFSDKDLEKLNHKIILKRDFSEIAPILKDLDINLDEDVWNLIRENISNYTQIKTWLKILSGDFKAKLNEDDVNYISAIIDLVPDKLTSDNFKSFVMAITNKTARKGRELFHPLRIALTNEENGPELSKIVDILGSQKIKKRLENVK